MPSHHKCVCEDHMHVASTFKVSTTASDKSRSSVELREGGGAWEHPLIILGIINKLGKTKSEIWLKAHGILQIFENWVIPVTFSYFGNLAWIEKVSLSISQNGSWRPFLQWDLVFLILHLEEIRETGRLLTGQMQEIEIYNFFIKGTVFDF